MARLALQRALEPQWLDELFEQHRQTQYTRELLFSTTVEVMSVVAVGLRPSIRAAAQATADTLPVSLTALYDKINRTEPALVRALVAGSAERLQPVAQPMLQGRSATVPGWRLRILDGNHLPASDKRLKPLRGLRGAALPGQSLVVYDPDLDMIVDLVPCEDGHAQERALMGPILESAQSGELWIADRNFCTRAILTGWHGRNSAFIVREHGRNSAFIVREHGRSPNPVEVDHPRKAGRVDAGTVYEQAVSIDDENGVSDRHIPATRESAYSGQVKPAADFSDRGRLFQADRGRRIGVVGDALGKRASLGWNVAQSSTISLKRAVVGSAMGRCWGCLIFRFQAPARPPEAPPRPRMYA